MGLRVVCWMGLCLGSVALFSVAAPPAAKPPRPAPSTAPSSTAPTSMPTSRPGMSREEQVKALLDYLNAEHGKLLKSNDWIERSLAVISIARLPGAQATDQILGAAKNDPLPVVRLVAWQAMLSRAKVLDVVQYQQWMDVTDAMVKKGFFRGTTRVGLLRVMAQNPPSRSAKMLFVSIFGATNALEPRDIPVLEAMGDCLSAWQTPDVAEYLFSRLSDLNDAYRAEFILQRAGIRSPWAGEHLDLGSQAMWKLAIDNYGTYWKQSRGLWRPLEKAGPECWKTLEPQFIPAADLETPIDPNDLVWRRETELGRVDPKPMDVAFVVDATGSMQHVIDFLKRDIGQIKASLELVANQPRIGLTFYRDHGDMFVTRSVKLTEKLNTLDAFLSTMDAAGGADRPEAVMDALVDCIKGNPWAWKRDGRRAIVLMTDAPPKPKSVQECVSIAGKLKENNIALHVMKVRARGVDQSDLSSLDDMAAAAGTEAMWMPLLLRDRTRFTLPPLVHREGLDGVLVAYAPPDDSADRQIMKRLMVSAINPKFADRVEPLVDILLAVTAPSAVEKRNPFGVVPPPVQGGGGGGGNVPPRDPQSR